MDCHRTKIISEPRVRLIWGNGQGRQIYNKSELPNRIMSGHVNTHAKRAGNKGRGVTAGYDERKVEYGIDTI